MWMLVGGASRPDAMYWPGRRWLAVVDALGWPVFRMVLVANAPFRTGVVGMVVAAGGVLAAVVRVHRAVWRNERYRFTTWRWGMPVAGLVAMGGLMKLLSA